MDIFQAIIQKLNYSDLCALVGILSDRTRKRGFSRHRRSMIVMTFTEAMKRPEATQHED